jgi:hypothetical protein
MHGIVVGVPHGISEPAAVDYASAVSDHTGAGLVTAYGFGAKRVPVSQPLVGNFVSSPRDQASALRGGGSIYPEFKKLLRTVANGQVEIYFGIRLADEKSGLDRIEIATTGLTREQLNRLRAAFAVIRNREINGTGVSSVEVALDSLDTLTWQVSGVKYHGVLLAERGFNLRLPRSLSKDPAKQIYQRILSQWSELAIEMIRENPAGLPATKIIVSDFGKIETLAGRHKNGIVIGAPHGSFDVYTAGMARRICSRTGIAGVIATGFTPTETRNRARINVNRPTERYVTFSDREFETERARTTYEQFKQSVLSAARGKLALYIDLHQNGGTRIEVATVGVSRDEASFIRHTYSVLRNQALAATPDMTAVDLAIEPLNELEVGAWATKTNGILTVPARGLHFELPADGVMGSPRDREIYTQILGELIRRITDGITTAKNS